MTLVTPFGEFMLYAFLVVGIVASVVSLAVIAEVVTSSRRDRRQRHESIRHYYRGLAVSH